MKLTVGTIESIAKKLQDKPAVNSASREVTRQEGISMLKGEIYHLQKKGYTLEQISEMITAEGFAITQPTLKSYLQRSKLDKPKNKKTKGSFDPMPYLVNKLSDVKIKARTVGNHVEHEISEVGISESSFIVNQDTKEI